MNNLRLAQIVELPADVPDRPAKIYVLGIHKVPLIEPANPFERLLATQEAPAIKFDGVAAVVGIMVRQPPFEPLPGPRGHEQGMEKLFPGRRKILQAQFLHFAVRVQHFTAECANIGIAAKKLNHPLERIFA